MNARVVGEQGKSCRVDIPTIHNSIITKTIIDIHFAQFVDYVVVIIDTIGNNNESFHYNNNENGMSRPFGGMNR